MRIFCIEDFIEDFKINGEYQFTFADRDFLVTLVNHYRTKQAWIKALKKAFNYPLDKRNFENLNREYFCKFQHSDELIAELRFAVEGFLEMYNRLETISKDAKKKFEQTIQIATQYPIMAFKQFFSKRIFNMCTSAITLEDVTHSLDGSFSTTTISGFIPPLPSSIPLYPTHKIALSLSAKNEPKNFRTR